MLHGWYSRFFQVIVPDEEFDSPEVILDLRGEGQCLADEARKALPQRVVEALDVVGFPCLLCDPFVALRRHDAIVYFIVVRVKRGVVLIDLGDRGLQGSLNLSLRHEVARLIVWHVVTRPVVPSAVSYADVREGNTPYRACGHGTHSH